MGAKLGAVATVVVVPLAVAGCGSPTSSAGGSDGGNADALQGVYAEVEDLEGEERLEKLEELAAEEDASPTWYTSMPQRDSKPLINRFAEKYGIEVELYRAASSDVTQRLLQESKADNPGADLPALNGPEMQILDGEDLLLPLETPTREEITEDARFDAWLGIYLTVSAAAWNTNALSESDYPTSWEQVLTGYPGQLAMEAKAWEWFTTLVEEHFMAEKAMSEDEAVDLFRQAARRAPVVDGNTTIAELLAAGEYDLVAPTYKNGTAQLEDDRAPVSWNHPVEPVVVWPDGIGIDRSTDAPASSFAVHRIRADRRPAARRRCIPDTGKHGVRRPPGALRVDHRRPRQAGRRARQAGETLRKSSPRIRHGRGRARRSHVSQGW